MRDFATNVAMFMLPGLPLFFWVRGIVRANKSDLAAGILLLVIICLGILGAAVSSAALTSVGHILIAFGLVTLGAWPFARENALFKRTDLILAVIVFVVLGVAGLLVL